jgi:hypothetical protein
VFFILSSGVKLVLSVETTSELEPNENDEEMGENLVLSIFCVLFCICILFIGSAIAYFSCAEDALMRDLRLNATITEAKILESTLLRNRQHRAFVEYRYMEAGGYVTVVRKPVVVAESDISEIEHPHRQIKIHVELEEKFQVDSSSRLSFDDAIFDEPPQKFIKICVLTEHPRSGVPLGQVDRILQRRCSTSMLVTALLILALFCLYIGLYPLEMFRTSGLGLGGWSVLILLGMGIFEILGVHILLHSTFQKSLIDEYLEGGEMLVKFEDEETLATISTGGSFSEGTSPPSTVIIVGKR